MSPVFELFLQSLSLFVEVAIPKIQNLFPKIYSFLIYDLVSDFDQLFLSCFIFKNHYHLVNDGGCPASTLIMFPVDLEDSSDAKKYKASATSSGYTFFFKRLRFL